ncbi:hypothetical protein, partial [Escherichia coli]
HSSDDKDVIAIDGK